MDSPIIALTISNLRMIVRDRMLHAVFGVAFCMLLMIPSLSTFSMRQVQELAITLSLSAVSLSLLIMTLVLGSMSIWRDVERKFTASVLTLPVSRASYVLAKFLAIVLFVMACAIILGGVSAVVIAISSSQYPSDLPLRWDSLTIAIAADVFKFLLLAAVALLFSSFSTSFSLPFFGTIGIYLAGSASQEVYEYVSGEFGQSIAPFSLMLIKGVYFLLPNFSAFDYTVPAVYALDISLESLLYAFCYGMTYTTILLSVAVWGFSRRQLP